VDPKDENLLQLIYSQCVEVGLFRPVLRFKMVVSSEIPVPRGDAVYLAAMQLYVTFGPFDATRHKIGFLE
jgi:hypothetical protein